MSLNFSPPSTDEKSITNQLHGLDITDPYQWLEDKEDPKVIEWTQEQHEFTQSFLDKHMPAVKGLKEEITAYLDRDIQGPIFLIGQRQFFYLKKQGEPQYKLLTRIDGKDQVIFDPSALDPSGKSAIVGAKFTKQGEKVAVGVQYKGAEISTYYITDSSSGEQIGTSIEGLRGFSWTKDEQHAYITVGTQEMLEQQIPIKTYLHKLGAKRETDQFLGAPKDAKNFYTVFDAQESDCTFISEGDFYSNTLHLATAGKTEKTTRIYSSKKDRAEPYALGDKIYFHTNDQAPNFKVMVVDKSNPAFTNWKTLIPESSDMVIEGFEVTKDYLLLKGKKEVISRLYMYDLEGTFIKEIEAPEVGNISTLSYHRASHTFFVNLATFSAPPKVFKLDGATQKWSLHFTRELSIDTKNIEASIQFYPSKDGTQIPIFIMHQKGLEKTGNHPTMLYGYGGFNVGMSPGFIGLPATFINRGGVYAIACIRGGDEYGEQWHNDGMLEKKQNCFDDFIAGAEFLISEGYTNTQKLAIKGGSNGGLLMGAMVTQRPDLFKAPICNVPLLDMIRYHKFLIARYWIPEYGDPDKKEDFQNILKYSPYHNIRRGLNHPTMMIIAGENDTRVDPLHAKKMVAALQNNLGQKNPILLYMDFDSGHGSGKSTDQQIVDLDYQYRFLMNVLEMDVV